MRKLRASNIWTVLHKTTTRFLFGGVSYSAHIHRNNDRKTLSLGRINRPSYHTNKIVCCQIESQEEKKIDKMAQWFWWRSYCACKQWQRRNDTLNDRVEWKRRVITKYGRKCNDVAGNKRFDWNENIVDCQPQEHGIVMKSTASKNTPIL